MSQLLFLFGSLIHVSDKKMGKLRIYCNSCNGETWHELVSHYEHQRHNYFWGYPQLFVSDTFKCCGCEDITFRLIKHPFEFQDENDEPEELLFPERKFKNRDRRYFFNLPKHIHNLYQETISAHNNELIILSTVGLRSLIEAIVADKIDSSEFRNNLESKIDSLKPYFQESVTNTLHEFRIMGNKATHELEAPEKLNIHHALYVVEGMLEYFYGIEDHVETFRRHRESPKS